MIGIFLNIDTQNQKIIKEWETIGGYVDDDMVKKYQELHILNKDNKLENNTTIYITPLSEFPPYKLKNYVKENGLNIKTARKLDKIDTLIINHNFITSSYIKKPNKYYIIPSEIIFKNSNFKKYIGTGWYNNINEIHNKEVTHYFISEERYQNFIHLDSKFSIINEYPLIKCVPIFNNWGDKKVIDSTPFFLDLFNKIEKYNLKVIFDHNINDTINEGLSIDEDIFENIINMASSKDESNLKLAKEILANMEFEPSKPYLIYLLNYFYKLNQNTSGSKNYNYLKKQIKKYIHIYSTKNNPTTFNNFLPILIEKYPEYAQIFMNCFRIHMNIMLKKNIIKEIQTY